MEQIIKPPRIETGGYLTVKEYAEKKGTTVQAVYQKIARSTVDVKRLGNYILVKDL